MIDVAQQHIYFRERNGSLRSILDGVTLFTLLLISFGLSYMMLLLYLMHLSHMHLLLGSSACNSLMKLS